MRVRDETRIRGDCWMWAAGSKVGMGIILALWFIGLLSCVSHSQAQNPSGAVQWGSTGSSALNGILNASLIPTTTSGVRYSNVNGEGYDVVVITQGLTNDGETVLPWNREPGWWIEGPAASKAGASIPYSTVEVLFYQQGTNVPFGLTGVNFSFQSAKVGERLRNFSYWDGTGNQVAVSFTNGNIFSYSSGGPNVYASDGSIDSGSPYVPGTVQGDSIGVNLSPLVISGFSFQAGRYDSAYGNMILTALGDLVPTGAFVIESGNDQNVSPGPDFISTSGNAILTPASIEAALSGTNVTIATRSGLSQNINIDEDIVSGSGNALEMQASQNIVSATASLILSSLYGDGGPISLSGTQSVFTGHMEACANSGTGGSISVMAGNAIEVTGGIDTSASNQVGQGGDITLTAGSTLTVDSVRSGGGGSGSQLGPPGDITLTASDSINVAAIYDDSGSGTNPQAGFAAPSIVIGESSNDLSDIDGTLYLTGSNVAIQGTVVGTGGVVIDTGSGGVANIYTSTQYTGETDILSGTLAMQGNSLENSDLVLDNTSSFAPGVETPGGYVVLNSITASWQTTVSMTLTSSTTYDQVQAAQANLYGGIFNLTLAPGFIPAMGDVYPVMIYSGETGNFGSYQGLRLSDRVLKPVLTGTGLSLVTSPIPSGAALPLQVVPADGLNVASGGAYGGLTTDLQTAGGLLAATLIDGTASGATTVTMGLAASGTANFEIQGSLGGILANVEGTGPDKYVVQLDYNQGAALAAAGDQRRLFLASSDGTTPFANAVDANTDLPDEANQPTKFHRAYNPATDFVLGYYGVDTVNNRVWAVVDYAGYFGLGAHDVTATPVGPVSATEPAGGVLALTATLNGLVNPDGFDTTTFFESGTSPNLVGSTATTGVDIGSTAGFVQASCTLGGLTPNTTYYFRTDAVTTSGTEYGGILCFTTVPDPVISDSASTSFTTGEAMFNGSVNPQGFDTTVYYQYGATPGFGSETPSQDIGSGAGEVLVSGTPGELLPNTTYFYQFVATSALGTFYGPLQTFTTETSPVSIALTRVDDPGNAPDSTENDDGTSGYGEVDYLYDIGTFDVTLNQYAAFLNAVATQADPYGLYNTNLKADENIKGIVRSGSAGSYCYVVTGSSGDNPVTYVSWLDAARFCNWLQNGEPATGMENASTTEQGAYTLNGDTTQGMETKNPGTQWWIPSEDEWYKAAYYDPTLNGSGGYWTFATRSNAAPGNIVGSGANEANFVTSNDYFSVTQSDSYSASQGYLTPVGSFTGSASYYGTYDQGGDVCQWNDAVVGNGITGLSRGQRGGDWGDGAAALGSSYRTSEYPAGNYTGFRVASVDAPLTLENAALLTSTSVTLSGAVNPNGYAGPESDPANVYVSWQYGLAQGNYTQATAAQPVGTGATYIPVSITMDMSGLAPAVYHYQMVVSSTLGDTYGPDQVFSVEPPTVGYNAPMTTGSSAYLSLTVNPNGLDTMISIEYGPATGVYTSGSTAYQDIGSGFSSVPMKTNVTGLTPYTTYHYAVVTSNVLGIVQGPDEVFTTGPTYTMNTARVTGTTVMLSARVNPNGCIGPAKTPANDYAYWQYGVAAGSYTKTTAQQPIGTGTSPVAVSVIEVNGGRYGLSPAIYHYRLVITSTLGLTYSPDETFSVDPPTPAYAATVTTNTTGALSLTVNPNGLDTTVSIQYGQTTAYGGTILVGDIGSGTAPISINESLSGLGANTAYYYRIVTSNALGTVDGPPQIFATQALFGMTELVSPKDPAPGIAGAKFTGFGDPAINDSDDLAFQGTVSGSGITAAHATGIWADMGGAGLTLITQTGMTAPGYTPGTMVGTFSALSDPVYADDDAVAFLGTLAVTGTLPGDVTTTTNKGIWATTSGALALVARAGDPAPGFLGNTDSNSPVFASFSQFVLPDEGGVVILATLKSGTSKAPAPGGVIPSDAVGIWAVDEGGSLTEIIRTGDALSVEGKVKTVSALAIFYAPPASTGQTRHFDSNGDLAYKVSYSDGSSSIVTTDAADGTAPVFSTKDVAAGITTAKYSAFGNPEFNDSEGLAFQATVTGSAGAGVTASNNSGIWTDTQADGLILNVRTGMAAPGYAQGTAVGVFSVLSDPVFADDDAIAFAGTMVVTGTLSSDVTKTNNSGIWATTSGALQLVARVGDRAPDSTGTVSPGGPVFVTLSQFVLPDQGGVILLGTLQSGTPAAPGPGGVISTNRQGIWAVDTNGTLRQIVRTGQALNVEGSVKIISALTIFNAPGASIGQTRHFNNAGNLEYKASFTDGTTSILQSVIP